MQNSKSSQKSSKWKLNLTCKADDRSKASNHPHYSNQQSLINSQNGIQIVDFRLKYCKPDSRAFSFIVGEKLVSYQLKQYSLWGGDWQAAVRKRLFSKEVDGIGAKAEAVGERVQ